MLHEVYLGPIRSQINNKALLLKRLRRNSEDVEGDYALIPMHTGRSAASLSVQDGGTLPAADRQRYTTVRVKVKYHYHTVQVTGPSMSASRTGRGAFLRSLESEMAGAARDARLEKNRQCWQDGSGRIAAIVSAATPNITCKNLWDYSSQSPLLKGVKVGDRVAIEDVSAGGVQALGATGNYVDITAVNPSTKVITLSAAITAAVAQGDHLIKGTGTGDTVSINTTSFRGRSGATALDPKEQMGLMGIINGPNGWPITPFAVGGAYVPSWDAGLTGDLYAGASSASTFVRAKLQEWADPLWASYVDFNAGVPRPITTRMIQKMMDGVEELGEAAFTVMISDYATRLPILDVMAQDRRFVNAQAYKLDGGWEAIDFNGVPITVDKDAPTGALIGLHEPDLEFFQESDWFWLDKDGSILVRTSRADAWEATLAKYDELGSHRRSVHGAIGDIAII